jgi:hypothetical protein
MLSKFMPVAELWLPIIGVGIFFAWAIGAWYSEHKILAIWLAFASAVCLLLLVTLQVQNSIIQTDTHAPKVDQPDRPWVYFAEVSVQAPLSYDVDGANVVLAYIVENMGGSPANRVRIDVWPLAFQVGRNDPIEHQLFHLKTLNQRNDSFAAVEDVKFQQGLIGITLFRGEKRGFIISTRINRSELDEASKYTNGEFLIMVSAVIEYKLSGSDRVHRTCRIFHLSKDGGMGIKVNEGDIPVNRLAVKPHFQGDCAD